MSSTELAPTQDWQQAVAQVAQLVQQVTAKGTAEEVPDEVVQALLVTAVKLYVAKREGGYDLPAAGNEILTATEVAVTATALLEAANLELFELNLWNGWGRV